MNDGTDDGDGAGTTCSIPAAGQQFLSQMAEQLTSGAVHEAMQNLFLWLSWQRIPHRRDNGARLPPTASGIRSQPCSTRTS